MDPASGLTLEGLILVIILATLAALVYSMRVLVLLERRIARIDVHIEKMSQAMLDEEIKIEKQLKGKKNAGKNSKKH